MNSYDGEFVRGGQNRPKAIGINGHFPNRSGMTDLVILPVLFSSCCPAILLMALRSFLSCHGAHGKGARRFLSMLNKLCQAATLWAVSAAFGDGFNERPSDYTCVLHRFRCRAPNSELGQGLSGDSICTVDCLRQSGLVKR